METSLELEYRNELSSPTPSSPPPEPRYPSFNYEGTKELDLPDEGELTVRYRKVREESSVDSKGKHYYACTIEVRAICDVEGEDEDEDGEEESPRQERTEDVLDKIMATMEKMVKKDEEVHEMIEK